MDSASADARTGSGHALPRTWLPLLFAILLAAIFVAASDTSVAWLTLICLGCCAFGLAFWFGDLKRVALFMLVLTTPVDLSKALIVEGGVYSPGLSLFLSDIFFLSLLALWSFHRIIVLRTPVSLDQLHRVALLFLAWLWVSATYSQDVMAGALAALTYTKFFVTYFLLTQLIRKPADLRLVLLAFFAGFVLQALYVGAQVLTGSALEFQGAKSTHLGTHLVFGSAGGMHAFRPAGFLHHPNVLADYLVFLLPPAAALSLLGRRRIGRGAWMAAVAVLVAGTGMLVVTLSRGGWIALGVAGVFFAIAGLRRGFVKGHHVTSILATGLVGMALVAALYPAAYLRISQSDQRSGESRLMMIDQAMLIIRENPMLGVGLGGYNRAAQQYTPESFSYVSTFFQDEIRKGVVHNKYLLHTAETGIVGMGLFLHLLWRFFSLLFPFSRWSSPIGYAMALGLSSSILGQMAFFVFDHFYADIRMAMLWVTFGIYHALALGHVDGFGRKGASGRGLS